MGVGMLCEHPQWGHGWSSQWGTRRARGRPVIPRAGITADTMVKSKENRACAGFRKNTTTGARAPTRKNESFMVAPESPRSARWHFPRRKKKIATTTEGLAQDTREQTLLTVPGGPRSGS